MRIENTAMAYWFRSLYSPGNYWRNHIVSWLVPNLVLLSVFTIGAGWVSSLFRCAPLVRMGNVSFECYLLHQIIIKLYVINNIMPEMSQSGKIVSFMYCLAVSLLLALLLNKANGRSSKYPG